MPDKIRNFPYNAISHVERHRAKYAAGATFVATVWLFNKIDRKAQWDAFLEEKGLTDEFYTPFED